MASRKCLATALATMAFGLVAVIGLRAQHTEANHSMYLTFNRPVALPGVTLASGTYVFEFPDRMAAHNVVRILSRDRRQVYLTAFTQTVNRPLDMPRGQYVSFSESSSLAPPPIAVWWPMNMSSGAQFIYPR